MKLIRKTYLLDQADLSNIKVPEGELIESIDRVSGTSDSFILITKLVGSP